MAENDDTASSNAHLDDADDTDAAEDKDSEGGGIRPSGTDKAAHAGSVGQHPDKMREQGTVDPDKPDPSGGPPG